MKTRIQSRGRRVEKQKEQGLPKRELVREIRIVKLKTRSVGKGCLSALLRNEFLIYLCTKRIPSSESGLSSRGSHRSRFSSHDKLKKLATVHPRLLHRFATEYCSAALQPPRQALHHHTTSGIISFIQIFYRQSAYSYHLGLLRS